MSAEHDHDHGHDHDHDHDHDHHHDHHHHHEHGSELTPLELRVRALESLLVEKGYVDPAALDAIVETYETRVGPRNGARVVAKAWADPAYRARLLADATAAIAELGFSGRGGEHMLVKANTPDDHHMIVCTLCSCYPWPVLGLPPVWYKSAPYRSRAVMDPRGVLADFGIKLPDATRIHVWDSNSELRYIVLPMRPEGTEGWSEEQLAELVTRDSMIGTGLPLSPGATAMNGVHDLGGMAGFGAVKPERDEPVFHGDWEKRVLAMSVAMGATGAWNIDMSRFAREDRPPREYLSLSYYEIWLAGLERLLVEKGLAAADETKSGQMATPGLPLPRKLVAETVAPVLLRGAPADRPTIVEPRFAPGDRVITSRDNPPGHTRLPRYARGRIGIVTDHHGTHVFPDVHAHGGGDGAMHMYTITFKACDLWGETTSAATVSLNCWESYLEAAP